MRSTSRAALCLALAALLLAACAGVRASGAPPAPTVAIEPLALRDAGAIPLFAGVRVYEAATERRTGDVRVPYSDELLRAWAVADERALVAWSRDAAGLWRPHSWMELASPDGWRRNPALVLEFYDERRAKAWRAQPNAAPLAIASLEKKFDVTVITQNVDALHECAGSTRVLHVHGELAYARGTGPSRRRYRVDDAPLRPTPCARRARCSGARSRARAGTAPSRRCV